MEKLILAFLFIGNELYVIYEKSIDIPEFIPEGLRIIPLDGFDEFVDEQFCCYIYDMEIRIILYYLVPYRLHKVSLSKTTLSINEKRIIYVGTSKCAANYSGIDPTYGCTAEYFLLNNALDEDINNYLLASTALPYIYSPVPIRGNKYLDGGINDNIPIKPLYDLGIRRFIVIELTPDSKFDKTKFPDAEFISIVPSHDLGDLFTGTLNFENKDKRFKKELGERDGRIYVKTKFEKDETYIAIERAMLEMEFKNIVNENAHQEIQNKLESSVNGNLDKFTSIASKYGIDDIL